MAAGTPWDGRKRTYGQVGEARAGHPASLPGPGVQEAGNTIPGPWEGRGLSQPPQEAGGGGQSGRSTFTERGASHLKSRWGFLSSVEEGAKSVFNYVL